MTKHIPDQPNSQASSSDTEVIPLTEEELRLDKRMVTTGKVRVQTSVDVETELVKATLDGETVEVTRVPVDRIIDHAPEIRTENDVTIIPILEEVLVVEKRLVLKEELHVHKRRTREDVETPVELRKQRAVIERMPVDDDTKSNS
ncbi:YsnF/AvaK domain-containing protein [Microvirga sp. CF3062]|uniref:YsnF/AvaK domain-containing protein n=1 Tax=Microvirga sp. CF3062 TaxID=3110182 RepID=UPI002E7A6527|nr:YsnF/AvaK domain-containing protein [Microvirga sp. CF3062]MEE1657287.1 YsnF/AvaK domain-containing protein [Microvirga sp. CF3062]